MIIKQKTEDCVPLPLDSRAVGSFENGVNRCEMVCIMFPAHEHESICTYDHISVISFLCLSGLKEVACSYKTKGKRMKRRQNVGEEI